MKVKAYGKVNLALAVGGVREDRKHDMNMINGRVNCFDELDIQPIDRDVDEIECPGFHIPPQNLSLIHI